MRDRVTISFYSLETDEGLGFTQDFLSQISNIEKIYKGLIDAAKNSRREPPEFIISLLLVPNWDRKDNSYENESYLAKKNQFFEEFKNQIKRFKGMMIEDFYSEGALSIEEKAYMKNLRARGSTADIIKTRAIINNLDRCQHLQLDSNTVVHSFQELYLKTFGATIQKDGINASFYDANYISAHNKMVYTTPVGYLAMRGQLEKHLRDWCKNHQNDDGDKVKEKNSIYSKVFTQALYEIGYVKTYILTQTGKTIYPATLDDKVYWLTNCMTTAINMSWSSTDIRMNSGLKEVSAVTAGKDGLFNYPCFLNVIKKYTGDLSAHSLALGLNDTSDFGDASRELLINLSNYDLELQATREFILNVTQMNDSKLTNALLLSFEDNINGNKLTNILFKCSVEELPGKLKNDLSPNNLTAASEKEEKKVSDRPKLV